MTGRPRLLFLCQTVPYPPDSGVAIRSFHVLRLLAPHFDVTALCFYRRKGGAVPRGDLAQRLSALRPLAAVEAFPVPQEHSAWRLGWDHVRSVGSQRVHTTFVFDSPVVPNGVDIEAFRPTAGREEGLVFVGELTWFPNRDALQFFTDEILPRVRALNGETPARWVGRASEEDRRQYRDGWGIELTGYVADVRPYVRDAACFVVPLRVGGGTRLKILDAWAMGKAVVSTSVGCEGLAAEDGRNILIRDDPAEFARAVCDVLRDQSLRARLGAAARQTVEQHYSWERIGGPMLQLYDALQDSSAALSVAR